MSSSIELKLDFLYRKLGWNTLRNQLGGALKTTAISRNHFEERILALVKSKPDTESIIDDFYNKALLGGKHYLKAFELEPADTAKINAWLTNHAISKTKMSALYPIPLPENDLIKELQAYQFMEVAPASSLNPDAVTAIFCNKATFTSTELIEPTMLSADGKKLVSDGVEVFVRKRCVTQCYSFISIDVKTNRLVIAVDGSDLPATESSAQFAALLRVIKSECPIDLTGRINFFPAVDRLYQKPDGDISMVAFLTPDGNNSSLRLKPSSQCVRIDSYHKAGEQVGVNSKYRLGKRWNKMTAHSIKPYSVQLELPGRRGMLDNLQDKLDQLHTIQCLNFDDIVFLLDKAMEP